MGGWQIEEAVNRCPSKAQLIHHIFTVSQNLILSRQFRLRVLEVLVRVHQTIADPEVVSICQCLQFLNRAGEVAKILDDLVRGPDERALLAYQVKNAPNITGGRVMMSLCRNSLDCPCVCHHIYRWLLSW